MGNKDFISEIEKYFEWGVAPLDVLEYLGKNAERFLSKLGLEPTPSNVQKLRDSAEHVIGWRLDNDVTTNDAEMFRKVDDFSTFYEKYKTKG